MSTNPNWCDGCTPDNCCGCPTPEFHFVDYLDIVPPRPDIHAAEAKELIDRLRQTMIIPDIHYGLPKSNFAIERLKQAIRDGAQIIYLDYECGLSDFNMEVDQPNRIDQEIVIQALPDVPEEIVVDDKRPYYRRFERRKKT